MLGELTLWNQARDTARLCPARIARGSSTNRKLSSISGAPVALQSFRVLRRGRGLPPLPRNPLFARASFLRCAPGRFLLTKPNTVPHNRDASVAALRLCSGSSRNAVLLPVGLSVQLRRNPPVYFAALSSAYTCVTNRCVVSAELGTFASKSAVVFAASTSSWVLP